MIIERADNFVEDEQREGKLAVISANDEKDSRKTSKKNEKCK